MANYQQNIKFISGDKKLFDNFEVGYFIAKGATTYIFEAVKKED